MTINWKVIYVHQGLPTVSYLIPPQAFVAGGVLWPFASALIKTSFLALYYELFGRNMGLLWILRGLFIVTCMFCLADMLSVLLLCRPLAYNWDKGIKGGSCGNERAGYVSNMFACLFIDFSILVLPLPVLWDLKMATRKKVVISGLLLCGLM